MLAQKGEHTISQTHSNREKKTILQQHCNNSSSNEANSVTEIETAVGGKMNKIQYKCNQISFLNPLERDNRQIYEIMFYVALEYKWQCTRNIFVAINPICLVDWISYMSIRWLWMNWPKFGHFLVDFIFISILSSIAIHSTMGLWRYRLNECLHTKNIAKLTKNHKYLYSHPKPKLWVFTSKVVYIFVATNIVRTKIPIAPEKSEKRDSPNRHPNCNWARLWIANAKSYRIVCG